MSEDVHFFGAEKLFFFLSLAQRKKQRDIHLSQTLPYMEELRSVADNAALYIKVKSTIKGRF